MAESNDVMRNIVRSILGLVLVAGATWLANYITDQIFGEESKETSA